MGIEAAVAELPHDVRKFLEELIEVSGTDSFTVGESFPQDYLQLERLGLIAVVARNQRQTTYQLTEGLYGALKSSMQQEVLERLAGKLAESRRDGKSASVPRLTGREIDVVRARASLANIGYNRRQIADLLSVSSKMVDRSSSNACYLYARDITSVVVAMLSKSVLSLDDLLCGKEEQLERIFKGLNANREAILHAIYYSALEKGSAKNSDLADSLGTTRRALTNVLHHMYDKWGFRPSHAQLGTIACAYVRWKERLTAENWKKATWGNGFHLTAELLSLLEEGASLGYSNASFCEHIAGQMSIESHDVRHRLINCRNALNVHDFPAMVIAALSSNYLQLGSLANGKTAELESWLADLTHKRKETLRAVYRSAIEKRQASARNLASILGVSVSSVEMRICYMYSKLPVVSNRLQLATAAYYLAVKDGVAQPAAAKADFALGLVLPDER